jgi:hypothetical protein
MDRDTAFNTLVQGFKEWIATNHAAHAPNTQLPDVPFTPPAHPTPWIRWSMHWTGSVTAGAGKKELRHTGMAFVELFWPSGVGYKDVGAMAKAVEDYYDDFSADTGRLQCKGINDGARPWTATPPQEPGYTRRTVNVPIRLMEHRA